jgi:hypothetical protein
MAALAGAAGSVRDSFDVPRLSDSATPAMTMIVPANSSR